MTALNDAFHALDRMAVQSTRRYRAETARITVRVDSWPDLVGCLRRVTEAKTGAEFLAVQADARRLLAQWERPEAFRPVEFGGNGND